MQKFLLNNEGPKGGGVGIFQVKFNLNLYKCATQTLLTQILPRHVTKQQKRIIS